MPGSNIPQRKGPSGPVNPGGEGGGITPPAGQIGGTAVDPLVIGITEDAGAGDELEFGNIPDDTFLKRVGTTIVGVAIAAAVSVTAPITGDGTVGDPLAIDAFDLTASYVSSGPNNTFLKGNGAGNPNTWETLFTTPANPDDNGKVVLASNGDFTYLGGGTAGNALIWTGTAWAAGVDFAALSPVTTGGFLANASTGFLRVGLASGSGSGVASAASAGNIRGARGTNGFQVFVRNNGDTADLSLIATDTVSGPTATFCGTAAGSFSPIIAAPAAGSITLRVSTTATQLQLTTASISSLIPRIEFFSTVATGTFGMQTTSSNGVTGGKVNFTGQDCTGTTTTGGAVDLRTGSGTTAGGLGRLMSGGGAVATAQRFGWNDTGIAFFTSTPVAQQTIAGSRGGNAALADLLTKLALTGLIVDGTSA